MEAKQKQDEEEAERSRLQQKHEMMRFNKEQIEAKQEMLKRMEAEEKALVDKMLQKFARDEEEDRLKERNRELFKQRFASEASKQRLEKHELEAQERARELKEQEALRKREQHKNRVIEEAKRVLLEQHKAQLEGFYKL